jgi:holdfast attachment protein HfaA
MGGWGSSTAIGNNLTVVTQGNNNTVIVNSTQINNGNISAGTNVGKSGNGQ